MIAEGSLVLILPWTNERRSVRWFDNRHVQFYGGKSCSRRDIRTFYGEDGAKRLAIWERLFPTRFFNFMFFRPGQHTQVEIETIFAGIGYFVEETSTG